MSRKVKIGTRGSKLALWQAHYTRDKLVAAGYEIEIRIITHQHIIDLFTLGKGDQLKARRQSGLHILGAVHCDVGLA